jgi:hypothetical protein
VKTPFAGEYAIFLLLALHIVTRLRELKLLGVRPRPGF